MNSTCQSYLSKTNCAVVGCSSTALHDRLFRFPRQKRRYREWAEFSLNPVLRNATDKRAYMCYKHFAENQFRDEEPKTLIYHATPSYHAVGVAGTRKTDSSSSDESDDSNLEQHYRSLVEHSYCVHDGNGIVDDDDCAPERMNSPNDPTKIDRPQVSGSIPFTMKQIALTMKQLRERERRIKAMKHLSVTELMPVNIWPHEKIKPFIQLTSDVGVQTNDPTQPTNIALETLRNWRQEYLTLSEPETVKDEYSTLKNASTISPTNLLLGDAQNLDKTFSQVSRSSESPVQSDSSNVETNSQLLQARSAVTNLSEDVLIHTQTPTKAVQQLFNSLLVDNTTMPEPKQGENTVSFQELTPTTQTNSSPKTSIKLKTYERTPNKVKDTSFLTSIASILSSSSSQDHLNTECPLRKNTRLDNCGEPLKINVEPREHPFLILASPETPTEGSLEPKESSTSDVEMETRQNDENRRQITIHKTIYPTFKTNSHCSKQKEILTVSDGIESNQGQLVDSTMENNTRQLVDSTMKTVTHCLKQKEILAVSDGIESNNQGQLVDSTMESNKRQLVDSTMESNKRQLADSTMKTVTHCSKQKEILAVSEQQNHEQQKPKHLHEISVQQTIDSPPTRKLYDDSEQQHINDKIEEQQKEFKTFTQVQESVDTILKTTRDKNNIVIIEDEVESLGDRQSLRTCFQKITDSNLRTVCKNLEKVTVDAKQERPDVREKFVSILKQKNTKIMNFETETPCITPTVEANSKTSLETRNIQSVISDHTESITRLPTFPQVTSKEVDEVTQSSQDVQGTKGQLTFIDLTIDDEVLPSSSKHFDKTSSIVDVRHLKNGFLNSSADLKTHLTEQNVKNHVTLQPAVKSTVSVKNHKNLELNEGKTQSISSLEMNSVVPKNMQKYSFKQVNNKGATRRTWQSVLLKTPKKVKSKTITKLGRNPESAAERDCIGVVIDPVFYTPRYQKTFQFLLKQKRKAMNIQSRCSKKKLRISIDLIKKHCSNLLKQNSITTIDKGPQSYVIDQNTNIFDQPSCKTLSSLDVHHTLPQDRSLYNKSNISNVESTLPQDVQSTLQHSQSSCRTALPQDRSLYNKSNISNVESTLPEDVRSTLQHSQSSCRTALPQDRSLYSKSNISNVESTLSQDFRSTLQHSQSSCRTALLQDRSVPSALSNVSFQTEVPNRPVRKQIDPSFVTYFKEHFNNVKPQTGKDKESNRGKTEPSEFKHCLEARLSLPFGINQKARENVLEDKQYNPQNIEVELKTALEPPINKKASLGSVKPSSQNETIKCVEINKPSSLSYQSVAERSRAECLQSNSSFLLRGFALKFSKNNYPLSKSCPSSNEIQSVDKCSTLHVEDSSTARLECEDDVQIIHEHIPNKVQKLGAGDEQTKELQCLSINYNKRNQPVRRKVPVVPAVIQQVLKSDCSGTAVINYLTNIQPMVLLDRSVTSFEQAVTKHMENSENNKKKSVKSDRQVFVNYGEQNLKLIGVSSTDLMEMDSSNPWVIKLESGWII